MRLQNPKRYTLELEIGPEPLVKAGFEFDRLKPHPAPQFDSRKVPIEKKLTLGNRLSPELLSHFPRAASAGGFMLDVGCGRRDFAEVCRVTNLEYIGLDSQGSEPDVLGDAHALPFEDDAFELILSMAVLEHIRHPLVAAREMHRVLKPGGLLLGTVAFLEPFHMDSYYHHSFLGTYNTLASAGFQVRQVSPNLQWTGLRALAHMNLLFGVRPAVIELLLLPLRALTRLWWTWEDIRYQTRGTWETWRQLATTAGYRFIAAKPAAVREGPLGEPSSATAAEPITP